MRVVRVLALLLLLAAVEGLIGCKGCARPQLLTLTTPVTVAVSTDSPVDLAVACPHLNVRDPLGATPVGPITVHVGDTLLFTLEDAGFYYAETITAVDPKDQPVALHRDFALRR